MIKSEELVLKKTHDYCASNHPRLAVVMIHGIASDSTTYNHILKHLEETKSLQDVRFITFDLLGSGQSLKNDDLNYDYKDQLSALHNSIEKLKLTVPLVLVGHSLGTFIVTRYADTYKKTVKQLILVSPPVYTERDFSSPAFEVGIKMFKEAVSIHNRRILDEKSFNNSMDHIVLDKRNYKVLAGVTTPTLLIYGNMDQLIASFNIPRVVKANPLHLSAIQTEGRHGVTMDKFIPMKKKIEEVLDAEAL